MESFKSHIPLRDGFVAFDSLQSERVAYTRIVDLARAGLKGRGPGAIFTGGPL